MRMSRIIHTQKTNHTYKREILSFSLPPTPQKNSIFPIGTLMPNKIQQWQSEKNKISPRDNRGACKRTPIKINGFILLFYFQMKQNKWWQTLSVLVWNSSICWGVFTVPVTGGGDCLFRLGSAELLQKEARVQSRLGQEERNRAPEPLRASPSPALCDWNVITQHRYTNTHSCTHVHTHTRLTLSAPPQALLQKRWHIHAQPQTNADDWMVVLSGRRHPSHNRSSA